MHPLAVPHVPADAAKDPHQLFEPLVGVEEIVLLAPGTPDSACLITLAASVAEAGVMD
jgi:hypothetical protein